MGICSYQCDSTDGGTRCHLVAKRCACVGDGLVFACMGCSQKNPELPWKSMAGELAQRAQARSFTIAGIAAVCGVRESSARHWWYGERIPNRHAGAIRDLLGVEGQRAVWASFSPRLGSGRRAADGGRRTLAAAARVLRGVGDMELAARVAARAEAIGEEARR